MIHKIPAMRKNMPRNGGTTLRMRRLSLVVFKSSLIDLEAWVQGDKGQAQAAWTT
jgi:hypothetical protein